MCQYLPASNSYALFVISALVVLTAYDGCRAQERTYCRQEFVDSLVNLAYYQLNATSDPGSGISTEHAISYGKSIIARLRNIAENDANKRYIIGKTGELENQIYLEEEGLLLEKQSWKNRNIKELIIAFNTELAKARPSFEILKSMHTRMSAIDNNKSAEIGASVKKRSVALGVEVRHKLELALENSNIDEARRELAYTLANRNHLGVSLSGYASLEAKVQAKTTIEDERVFVTNVIEELRESLERNDLAGARNASSVALGRLDVLKKSMIGRDWERIHLNWERYGRRARLKEDSLTAIGHNLLKTGNINLASAFLDTMRLRGVSSDKIARLNRSILETVVAEKKQEIALTGALTFLPEDTSETSSALDALLVTARQRAKAKADSLAGLQRSNDRLTQVAEVRRERLQVAQEQRDRRSIERTREDRGRAEGIVLDIYRRIEAKEVAAGGRLFEENREFLSQCIDKEDMDHLSRAVSQKLPRLTKGTNQGN